MNKKITWSAALDGYQLHASSRRLSPHTIDDYSRTFRKFTAHLADDPPLADIDAEQIERFLDAQAHLSKKTVLNIHTALSSLWTWATGRGIVDVHVARQVRPPKPKQKIIEIYTEREVQALINACDRSASYKRPAKRKSSHSRPSAIRDKAIILTLLDTLIRITELCNLRLTDLNQHTKIIKITSGAKGDKERIVPLSSETLEQIWHYHASRDLPKPRYQNYIFLNSSLRPLNKDGLGKLIRLTGRRAGVQANAHKFRHTGATEYIRNGGDVFTLQAILGHTTMAMVQRYVHLAQVDLESAHRRASPVYNWDLRT